MRIAIFGASGRTGMLLVRMSLAAGHTVTAMVRTPATFLLADQVRVVQGDAHDAVAIASTVEGADAVFCALGARSLSKDDTLERAVPLITAAMEAAGVQRLITLGNAGALETAMDKQLWIQKWIVENIVYATVLKWPVMAQRAQYKALVESRVDWTMALPPMLTEGAATGTVREDPDALPPWSLYCSRADVAGWMFRQLGSERWSRRAVYISH
jgi:putative NADH-flavin reductase